MIHVADCADIGTQSAFSMEYIAMAMAMTTAEGVSTKPVVSDAKAILDILPGRKAELRNTRKKHSIPLQQWIGSWTEELVSPYMSRRTLKNTNLTERHGLLT